MKYFIYASILTALVVSCKKQIIETDTIYLNNVKTGLKDSLSVGDYNQLDFSKAILDRVDSAHFFVLRIPFQQKSVQNDFVMIQTDAVGKIANGKIIHLEGRQYEFGMGRIKRRKFDGSISISSLDKSTIVNSAIRNGFIESFHSQLNTRDQSQLVYATDVLPEIVIVTYVQKNKGISFSTWMRLQSLFYDNVIGSGNGSNFYGSMDGGGDLGYSGGGIGDASLGGGSDATYNSVLIDPLMAVDVESYVNKEAIDIGKYLKCFENIPDDGATCSIEIFTDIPVDSDPNKLFNWNTESPGHCFIQLKKSNGSQSIQQNLGFYPKANWKNILSADPVESKIVDDSGHEFNASLKMNLTPFLLKSVLGKIRELSSMNYDMDEFNCADFALEVFNYVRAPIQIPQYVIPGGAYGTNTPQGLYNKLNELKNSNDREAQNITIGIIKGFVGSSSGACN